MKNMKEMNSYEKKGAIIVLKEEGFTPCLIGSDIPGWTKGRITIPENEIWFEED